MKKLFFIPLSICIAISTFSVHATKEERLVSQLFRSMVLIRESKLNKDTLSKLLVQVKSECIKYGLEEKRVINALITKIVDKKNAYEFRKKVENKYFGLKLLAGLTAFSALFAYLAIQNFREAPQDIQAATNDLRNNGVIVLTATGSHAKYLINSSADEFKMRSKLLDLIQAKKNSNPFYWISGVLLTVGALAASIDEWFNVRYTEYYCQKYSFIQAELEQYLHNIYKKKILLRNYDFLKSHDLLRFFH